MHYGRVDHVEHRPVAQHQGDRVAACYAECGQTARNPLDLGAIVGPCELDACAVIAQRGAICVANATGLECRTETHVVQRDL